MKPQVLQTVMTAALIALCLLPRTLYANGPQALLLDGRVRTKNISFEGVRLVVERNGITVQVMMKDLRHFQVQLDLQQEYVLTFYRESCLSKSLHIDTHVPAGALEAAPFHFPFLVTLEPRPKGHVVRYAEPVGQIYFMEGKADFGYGTDYSLARDHQRAALGRGTRAAVRSDGKGQRPSTDADRPGPMTSPAPTGPSPVGTDLPSEADRQAPARSKDASSAVIKEPPPHHEVVMVAPLYRSIPDGRTEDLQVLPTYLAKEVRITEGGRTRVYRKVTHRFGEVHYFCNGGACSEASFVSGTRSSTTPAP